MQVPPPGSELHRLMTRFPRAGAVRWIGLRPARDVPMQETDTAQAVAGGGLVGDRYKGGSGKRGLTLIQAEHLPVIAGCAGLAAVEPARLRRNLVISGLNLLAEFQPHIVKLDMALTRDIDRDAVRRAIVGGVIGTCKALGCQIIAEGIERREELHTLRDMGVTLFQGYLLARPALEALPEPDWRAC